MNGGWDDRHDDKRADYRVFAAARARFPFGLAFEEFNAQSRRTRAGDVRNFPLLALSIGSTPGIWCCQAIRGS
jgi:hypothetical protein